MNIDCEIGIRGDTCQCSALSLGCRQAWGRYRGATVACRHSSTLKAATFPLYLPREACLPFTGLIFLLEAPTIYSPLPSPSPSASHCAVSHPPLSPCHPRRSAMPIQLLFTVCVSYCIYPLPPPPLTFAATRRCGRGFTRRRRKWRK